VPVVSAASAGILIKGNAGLLKSFNWSEAAMLVASRFINQLEIKKESLAVFYEEKEGLGTFLSVAGSAFKSVQLTKNYMTAQKVLRAKNSCKIAVFLCASGFKKARAIWQNLQGEKKPWHKIHLFSCSFIQKRKPVFMIKCLKRFFRLCLWLPRQAGWRVVHASRGRKDPRKLRFGVGIEAWHRRSMARLRCKSCPAMAGEEE